MNAPKFTAYPRSAVFSKSANPLDLPQKSTIRAPFKAKSVDPKTFSPLHPPPLQKKYVSHEVIIMGEAVA